jgi:hypothetical protein
MGRYQLIKFFDNNNLRQTMIMIFSVWNNSYLYHKTRKCHFASTSMVCEAVASAEAPQVRAVAKHFPPV